MNAIEIICRALNAIKDYTINKVKNESISIERVKIKEDSLFFSTETMRTVGDKMEVERIDYEIALKGIKVLKQETKPYKIPS